MAMSGAEEDGACGFWAMVQGSADGRLPAKTPVNKGLADTVT
jgi:hypothetical protein